MYLFSRYWLKNLKIGNIKNSMFKNNSIFKNFDDSNFPHGCIVCIGNINNRGVSYTCEASDVNSINCYWWKGIELN